MTTSQQEREAEIVREALGQSRGYLRGTLRHISQEHLGASLCELLHLVDRAIGIAAPSSTIHDRGAFARCSFCGRYTSDARALSMHLHVTCDCGSDSGWSGSFVYPDDEARWSVSHSGCLRETAR